MSTPQVFLSCKGCLERHVGCHSICSKYIDAKAYVAEKNNKEHNCKLINDEVCQAKLHAIRGVVNSRKRALYR